MKKKIIAGLLVLLLLLILGKIFIGSLYYVPTSSMETTIKSGSHIFVWKYPYGARLPRSTSEILWLSTIIQLFGEWPLWSNTRMPPIDSIKHGDVCLAQFDLTNVVKRCVALPGDTLEIENGLVSINHQPEQVKPSYRYVYTATLTEEQLRAMKYVHASYLGKDRFELTVDAQSLHQLFTQGQHVKTKFYPKDTLEAEGTFPKRMRGIWNRNDFGPFVIPSAGMVIPLNPITCSLYEETLEKYENVRLEWTVSEVKVNGKQQGTYQFKNNYYFLMGDNRMEAMDSRFLGLFPRANVLGRVNE